MEKEELGRCATLRRTLGRKDRTGDPPEAKNRRRAQMALFMAEMGKTPNSTGLVGF
jgi:hypothetical protein